MHVHLAGSGKIQKKQRDNEKLVRRILSNPVSRAVAYRMVCGFARDELLGGVTTIRTVGGLSTFDTRLRDEIAVGRRVGPRILAANEGHLRARWAHGWFRRHRCRDDRPGAGAGGRRARAGRRPCETDDHRRRHGRDRARRARRAEDAARDGARRVRAGARARLHRGSAHRVARGRARGAGKRRGLHRARRKAGRGNSASVSRAGRVLVRDALARAAVRAL